MMFDNYFNKVTFNVTLWLLLLSFSPFCKANEPIAEGSRQSIAGNVVVTKFNTATKDFNNHPYKILSSPTFTSTGIRLIGKDYGIKKINTLLRKDFYSKIRSEGVCVNNDKKNPSVWVYTNNDSLIAWNDHSVVINSRYSFYCGGPHGDGGSAAKVYNLMSGKLELTNLWLSNEYQKNIPDDSNLNKKLHEQYRTQRSILLNSKSKEIKQLTATCDNAIRFTPKLWPMPNGLVFLPSTSYEDRFCMDSVMLPYVEVIPFLSERGKRKIQAFRK